MAKKVPRWRKIAVFLEEVKREVARQDGWKPSELAMALADVPVLAKRWARKFPNMGDAAVDGFLREARDLVLNPKKGGAR